jgi:hypothetical protein
MTFFKGEMPDWFNDKLKRAKMYDVKCHELAEAFLEEEQWMHTQNNLKELAQRIQNTIEDFIDELRAEKEREGQ